MPPAYTIQELASLAEVPVRTIKYYRRLRLLSPTLPIRGNSDGRQCYVYTHVHLEQLRQIRDILEHNRTLEDIRDILHPDLDEVEA